MRKSYILVILIFVLTWISCGPKVMYEESIKIATPWSYDQGVDFIFNVDDTTSTYNLILNVKYNQVFKYQNLYTKFNTRFPDGTKSNDITSLDIRDLSGKSQGKCSGDYCTVPFLIQEQTHFKSTGEHQIQLFQYSRQDTISGIESISLRIEEVE